MGSEKMNITSEDAIYQLKNLKERNPDGEKDSAALDLAITLLQAGVKDKNYYFTFGTDPAFPYGIEDFVIVRAESVKEACEKFKNRHPNRPGSPCINCSFYYSEKEWTDAVHSYYEGREPSEVIV